jgi:hypothetical protein
MSDDSTLSVLSEIRNMIRASTYPVIKNLLTTALPDLQTRKAFQMLDGNATVEQVRVACKMSPNKLVALTQKWTSMGLMEVTADKRKRRLFDLQDFDLVAASEE